MIYKRYFDAKEFYKATFSIMLKHEAQNSIPLGNIIIGNSGVEKNGWRDTKYWYMSTVSNNVGDIVLIAIMTPPFNITMYENDNLPNDEALNYLCDNIIKEKINVPGILSENNLAMRFAKKYTEKMNMEYSIHKNMRIYILREINKKIPIIGNIRKAEKKDLFFLPYWYKAFYVDCDFVSKDYNDIVIEIEREIIQERIYLLEDNGMPVSMASALRETVNGGCVGMVYTPPYLRGKGYASSCVAQVSQKILKRGYKFASLFTDLSNPISNSIYQKIGYMPICDYNDIIFKKIN